VTSRIFGVRSDHVQTPQRLREIDDRALDGDRVLRIFTPNPEILLRARDDPAFAAALNAADLALPDGTGVALVESFRARRRIRRWPGVELGELLLEAAAERGGMVALVGGASGVAEAAAGRWRRALPGLRIETAGGGITIGADGVAEPPDHDAELTRTVRSFEPTIVLVGLGAPKQERWILRNAEAIPSARIMVGLGGSFDMWAGSLRRAPALLRRLGLEWAWRLALEPRRLRRTATATIVFPLRALLESRGRGTRVASGDAGHRR
jgi:N-acetylglucosaminyldiphosphoundecaprenol N-acetyl-beta-D-mannosaminyltransferase